MGSDEGLAGRFSEAARSFGYGGGIGYHNDHRRLGARLDLVGVPEGAAIEQRVEAIEKNVQRVRDDISAHQKDPTNEPVPTTRS